MTEDSIIQEVRNAREEYFKQFNYDLDALFDAIEKQSVQNHRQEVLLSPKRADPVIDSSK
jgi:hypothetical protein